ncbi:uncharacterized [Tachysurus ichikawai]
MCWKREAGLHSFIIPVAASHRELDWHGLGFLPFFAWRLECVAAPPSCYSHVTRMLPDLCFRSPADRIMPQPPDFPLAALTHTHAHAGDHTCEPAMV